MLFFIGVVSCKSNALRDEDFFYGEIHRVKVPSVERLEMRENTGEHIYHTYFNVCDSLIVFYVDDGTSYFAVSDLRTKKCVGRFVGKGRGPNELIYAMPLIYQICENSDGDKCAAVYGLNEDRLMIWNISKSISKGCTVIDRAYSFKVHDYKYRYYYDYFILHDTLAVAYMSSTYTIVGQKELPVQAVRLLSLPQMDVLREYPLYKKIIDMTNSNLDWEKSQHYFHSLNAMKPDGTKYAMAMCKLPQINILDLESGEIKHCRLKGGVGVESFFGTEVKSYHSQTVCDDDYIYAMYYGFADKWKIDSTLEDKISNSPHLVHVYDWDGNLVKVFDLGIPVCSICVSDGVLWTMNWYTEQLLSCTIADKL